MKLSVLICTYNRPELLVQCLDALIWRTMERPDQVVVVNGGDERTDILVGNTRQKAEGNNIQIELVKTINKNLAASRNVGLAHCKGDIVAMTDDDAEVFPDWVVQMKRLHAEHPETGAVGGRLIGAHTVSYVTG